MKKIKIIKLKKFKNSAAITISAFRKYIGHQ